MSSEPITQATEIIKDPVEENVCPQRRLGYLDGCDCKVCEKELDDFFRKHDPDYDLYMEILRYQ